MSYRKKHIKARIHKIKPRKLFFLRPIFWYVLFSVIIISFGVYFFVFAGFFQVKNVNVSFEEKIDRESLKNFMLGSAEFKIFNFLFIHINSKSIFLVNKNKIAQDVLNSFTGIEKVSIKKNLPQTLSVTITERKPIGSFCSLDNCYLVDNNGIAFEKNYSPEQGTIIRKYQDYQSIHLGQEVLNSQVVEDIYRVQKILLNNLSLNAREVLIFDSSRMNVITSEGWQIYFNLDADIEDQLVKLNTMLVSGISDESKKNLYYIDLRPKDRAIFCDNSVCAENL